MRFKSEKTDGFEVLAVSGVNTVSFGIGMTAKATKGLLGFALKRKDLSGCVRPRTLTISLVLLFVTAVLHAETGIVFIHGKGSSDLQHRGTAFAYWGGDMVHTVAPVGQRRALVCHYDGTKSMRLAADDVAGQITTWLQDNKSVDKLIVVTHSFGGVIVRRILSHRARYGAIIDRITRVYSIAPPNRGSEAADLARTLSSKWYSEWIADLAGQDNPATKDCTTDMMNDYNQSVLLGTNSRRPLPTTLSLFNIAGIDVRNDGTHEEDKGLSWLVKFVEFGDRSDGMVAAYSAQAVGQPLPATDANHHHNRRNDYRKIGDRLAREVRR
jgi:pimeloyl-ACP methyl ester carboxylesterase